MALTIPQIINIGNVSCIYASNELQNGKPHGGLLDERLPSLIHAYRQGVEWLYELDPTNEDLDTLGNYLLSICKDAARAEANIIGGGSTPSITNPSFPTQLNFKVAASGTILVDGQSEVILPAGWAGFNVIVNKNGQPLTQITSAPIYYTWGKSSRLLTVVPAAFLDDEFQITPV